MGYQVVIQIEFMVEKVAEMQKKVDAVAARAGVEGDNVFTGIRRWWDGRYEETESGRTSRELKREIHATWDLVLEHDVSDAASKQKVDEWSASEPKEYKTRVTNSGAKGINRRYPGEVSPRKPGMSRTERSYSSRATMGLAHDIYTGSIARQ